MRVCSRNLSRKSVELCNFFLKKDAEDKAASPLNLCAAQGTTKQEYPLP